METKAPEKIFICDYGSEVSYEWHSESEFEAKGHNDIEYTRTDAFIEKASEWLQINLWRVVNEEPDFRQRFVTDFRNYMKGENK